VNFVGHKTKSVGLIPCKFEMSKTPIEMHLGEQAQTCAKTFAETAKPVAVAEYADVMSLQVGGRGRNNDDDRRWLDRRRIWIEGPNNWGARRKRVEYHDNANANNY
jgi:hypothetical protein